MRLPLLPICLALLLVGCGQPDRSGKNRSLAARALSDPDVKVREKAFDQFSQLETTAAVSQLLDALHHEPDDRLINRIREWLLAQPADRLLRLVPLLGKSEHFEVRVLLAAALGASRDPRRTAALLSLCDDPQPQVRRQAAFALRDKAPARLLRDKSPEVRMLVAELRGASDTDERDWRVLLAATNRPSRMRAADLPELFLGRAAPPTETVARGVRWLVRHQEFDGRWSGWAHNRRGVGGLPGIRHELAYADPALTGLTVLALLQSGARPGIGRVGQSLTRAIGYLRRLQKGNGRVGYSLKQQATIRKSLYGITAEPKQLIQLFNHAIAAWALVEAAATTRDTDIEIAAGRALLLLYQLRHEKYPWSRWLDPDDDVAYAGYAVGAICVARAATELPIEPSMIDGVKRYIKKVTHVASGRLHHGGQRAFCFGGLDSTATGLFIRQVTPQRMPITDALAARLLLARRPHWNGRFPEPATIEAMADDPGPLVNYHYWHFGALAIARLEGQGARAWRAELVQVLTTHQRRWPWIDGGSWDPCGPWSRVGGRIYATASALLALLAPRAYDWGAAK